MAKIRINSNKLPETIAREIRIRINTKGVSSVLVDRAKRRIRNSGDSTVKYPELWAKRHGVGYRKSGKPLMDTGHLMNMLSSDTKKTSKGSKWTLLDGSGYGLKHQEGFENIGPVVVPLNRKTARIVAWLGEPPHDVSALPDFLEEAPNMKEARAGKHGSITWDYYVIEADTKVPPRPIANNPPEDIKAITRVIKRAIKGVV